MKKLKGIKFNSEMVNAILEGRKTQTRRVVKVQPDYFKSEFSQTVSSTDRKHLDTCRWVVRSNEHSIDESLSSKRFNIPYQVGDKVFIKESFSIWDDGIVYRASNPECDGLTKWNPSQHMTQEQSRITLEITDIKVERLNDINYEDATSEGIWWDAPCAPNYLELAKYKIKEFEKLWNSIYKNDPVKSWEANPFVWCLTFKVVN